VCAFAEGIILHTYIKQTSKNTSNSLGYKIWVVNKRMNKKMNKDWGEDESEDGVKMFSMFIGRMNEDTGMICTYLH